MLKSILFPAFYGNIVILHESSFLKFSWICYCNIESCTCRVYKCSQSDGTNMNPDKDKKIGIWLVQNSHILSKRVMTSFWPFLSYCQYLINNQQQLFLRLGLSSPLWSLNTVIYNIFVWVNYDRLLKLSFSLALTTFCWLNWGVDALIVATTIVRMFLTWRSKSRLVFEKVGSSIYSEYKPLKYLYTIFFFF